MPNKSVTITSIRPLSFHRVFTAEDYGESQSHQHCNDRWYRHQRDRQVKGRITSHGRRPEQAALWLHRELPQHPVQSAAEGGFLLQKEKQHQGNTGWSQVSFAICTPSVSCLSRLCTSFFVHFFTGAALSIFGLTHKCSNCCSGLNVKFSVVLCPPSLCRVR